MSIAMSIAMAISMAMSMSNVNGNFNYIAITIGNKTELEALFASNKMFSKC